MPTPFDAELARRHLVDFLSLLVPSYERARHVELVAEHLEAVERRELERLIVTAPPRHSKSLTCAQGFPSWYLGRRPSESIILASYGAELAEAHSRRARGFLLDPRWPFPEVAVSAESAAVNRWQTTAGGGMIAAGVGGGITGHGAHALVLDDLIKDREQADSAAVRDAAWRWLVEVALTRLMPGGVVVAVGTRWHEDDPLGRLLNSPGAGRWTVLNLPALAEESDVLGRGEGEALWSTWYPAETLQQLRIDLGSRGFTALYQGKPTPSEGGTFKRVWLEGRYGTVPDGCRIVTACDASFGKSVASDYSALVTVAADERYFYVLDARRGLWQFNDLLGEIARAAEEWSPSALLVEDSAAGQSALQELQRETNLPVVGVPAKGSKEFRGENVSPLFEAGRVLFPEQSPPWRDDLIEELAAFPAGKHDDQLDAFGYALERLRSTGGGHGGVAGAIRHGSREGAALHEGMRRGLRGMVGVASGSGHTSAADRQRRRARREYVNPRLADE